MSKRICIVDYSLGNIYSVQQAFKHFGIEADLTNDHEKIASCDAIVLPGVGAFPQAMQNLNESGLINVIIDAVKKGKPLFGICLGMQLLFEESEEFECTKGLGIIKGKIKKFYFENPDIKVPEIEWNKIYEPQAKKWNSTVLNGIKNNEYMYFVHSYYALPDMKENVLALTNYNGFDYCSAVIDSNVVATQFHPEKSAREGLRIYENWIKQI